MEPFDFPGDGVEQADEPLLGLEAEDLPLIAGALHHEEQVRRMREGQQQDHGLSAENNYRGCMAILIGGLLILLILFVLYCGLSNCA